jgi:hypothetical protein
LLPLLGAKGKRGITCKREVGESLARRRVGGRGREEREEGERERGREGEREGERRRERRRGRRRGSEAGRKREQHSVNFLFRVMSPSHQDSVHEGIVSRFLRHVQRADFELSFGANMGSFAFLGFLPVLPGMATSKREERGRGGEGRRKRELREEGKEGKGERKEGSEHRKGQKI